MSKPPSVTGRYYSEQYNARASIPDHPHIFQRWARSSADARLAIQGQLDLAYGKLPGERLDFFPVADRAAPLLVFIHGGWWRSLDKSDFTFLAQAYQRAGFHVALTNYTLAPVASIEEIVRQQLKALTWLYRNSAACGFDRQAMVIAGHSAGAHLAAMMMAADWPLWAADLPADLIKAGILLSGIYDLAPVQHAAFVNGDLKLTPARVGPLSPGLMPKAQASRFLTAVGGLESDEFQRQTALIGTAWQSSHVGQIPLPEQNHLTICDAFGTPGHPLFEASVRLIAQHRQTSS